METNFDLNQAFASDELELRLRQSKVACVLGIALIPAGIFIDLIAYPEHVGLLAAIRVTAALLIAGIFSLHFIDALKPHVGFLTMLGLIIAVGSIALMISLTDAASSSYYLGLFLILFAVGVLAPMTTLEAAIVCVATILIYTSSCTAAAHSDLTSPALLNKLYFLTLTCIISVTAAHLNYKRRLNEFSLKFRLAAQHRELATLNRLKSQFFANVSHELRTPLTLILAPLEKIKAEGSALSTSARELLALVENNALRLLRLVNDILSLIKVEQGGGELAMKAFDLSSYLRGLHASMKHLAEMKSIKLTLTDKSERVHILADPEAMDKIASNIVTNAIKFTPEGGLINIEIDREDGCAVVKISDTGIGIPADKLGLIFDRFYQVDGSTTRQHQGLGLGLAMVRELMDRHNGSVDVTSVGGCGATFTLRFPQLADVPYEGVQLPAKAEVQKHVEPLQEFHRKAAMQILIPQTGDIKSIGSRSEHKENRSRVLVVDDEPDMRRYLAAMLGDDYSVIEAVDGNDALSKARSENPDIVLLDVMLPGISGLNVCKALKDEAETRGIKIIVLTARADEEAKITALKHGADDFLIKPFSGLEVMTRIANLLKATNLERDLKISNKELSQSLAQLKDTEAALVQNARLSALGTMAAGLLHEIGNPLNYMGTAIQLASRSKTITQNPDFLDIVTDIRAGHDRIRSIIGDLRGFTAPARPESCRPFNIEDAIEHALRFTAHMRKGITISKKYSGEAIVNGSMSSISQVLVNLIINAVAAVRSIEHLRQPEISISIEANLGVARVFIHDNGTGIDPAIKDQIFDPFFSTKEAGEGMGLGLAVSHRIVANHSGLLDVRSSPGEWTTFSVTLPLGNCGPSPALKDHHEAA